MIKINLLPYPEEIKKAKANTELAIFFGSIAILCLALFLFQMNKKNILSALRVKISELTVSIDKLKDVESLQTTIIAERDKTKARLDAINAVTRVRRNPIRHLDEITKIIPYGVWLSKFSVNQDNVATSCKSASYYDISKYYNNIKDSKYFDIDIFPSISESEKINEKPVYQFDLSFKAKGLVFEEPSKPPANTEKEKKESDIKKISDKINKS